MNMNGKRKKNGNENSNNTINNNNTSNSNSSNGSKTNNKIRKDDCSWKTDKNVYLDITDDPSMMISKTQFEFGSRCGKHLDKMKNNINIFTTITKQNCKRYNIYCKRKK